MADPAKILGKLRRNPDKSTAGDAIKMVEEFKKRGINVLNWYWTLGRYDILFIFEAENEKEAMEISIDV